VAALAEAVEKLGGRVEEREDGEVRLVFRKRGFSLSDLPREALEELLGYRLVVIVEEGFGEKGIGYYYYIKPVEVEKLLKESRGGEG
jgi:hypothetical protein